MTGWNCAHAIPIHHFMRATQLMDGCVTTFPRLKIKQMAPNAFRVARRQWRGARGGGGGGSAV